MTTMSNYGGWLDAKSTGTGASPFKAATVAVTIWASLIMPTGTAAQSDNLALLKDQNADGGYTRNLIPIAKQSIPENLPADNLKKTLSIFSPAISELAKIFGVSRQTIYNWKNGEKLNAENEIRLQDMAAAADIFIAAGISISGSILKRKIINNRNLFEIASAGESISTAAQILVLRLCKEQEQQSLIAARFGKRQLAKPSEDADFTAFNDRG